LAALIQHFRGAQKQGQRDGGTGRVVALPSTQQGIHTLTQGGLVFGACQLYVCPKVRLLHVLHTKCQTQVKVTRSILFSFFFRNYKINLKESPLPTK
jgi:hypothetical protein